DLVGRDAEKADLHAAYHRAVSPLQGSGSSPPLSTDAVSSQIPPSPGAPTLSDPGQRAPSQPPASLLPPRAGGRGEFVARAVVGEMGIGKTALVATFLSELP